MPYQSESQRQWFIRNRDRLNAEKRARRPFRTPEQKRRERETAAAWRRRNPEKMALYTMRSMLTRKDKRAATTAAWRARNQEHIRQYAASRARAMTPEQRRAKYAARKAKQTPAQAATRRESVRCWVRDNRDRKRESDRRYYERNKARAFAQARAWARAHPEARRAACARRYARKKAATIGDQVVVREFYKWVQAVARVRCRWCCRWVSRAHRRVDHIVPITRGGSHSIENLCVACSSCNSSKSNSLPLDWLAHPRMRVSASHFAHITGLPAPLYRDSAERANRQWHADVRDWRRLAIALGMATLADPRKRRAVHSPQ